MKRLRYGLAAVLIVIGLLAGCATPAATPTTAPPAPTATTAVEPTATTAAAEGAPAGDIALRITGMVEQELAWTEEQVLAMETMEAKSTNKAGEVSTYTGVSIAALLAQAKPAADAQTVIYVADDGFTGEVALSEVAACADCIVSFRNQGGFSIVMPGYPGNLQVKGVVEIQVK
ncbi:MAG: hypothetical protein JXA09_12530 [Anaerolineae bacterium]|nr:hypothetical protein [Anaerolineae bacterium]